MPQQTHAAAHPCPACKRGRLEPRELEPGLTAETCPQCAGAFVPFERYLAWQASAPTPAGSPGPHPEPQPAPDSTGAKLCPACGRFMTRLRIARDLPFHIDRCGGCAGMWFDRGEWEALRSQSLHTRIHTLFTDSHQHQLRHEESASQHEHRIRALVGEESFNRTRDFKRWLTSHPHQQTLRAYLDDRQIP